MLETRLTLFQGTYLIWEASHQLKIYPNQLLSALQGAQFTIRGDPQFELQFEGNLEIEVEKPYLSFWSQKPLSFTKNQLGTMLGYPHWIGVWFQDEVLSDFSFVSLRRCLVQRTRGFSIFKVNISIFTPLIYITASPIEFFNSNLPYFLKKSISWSNLAKNLLPSLTEYIYAFCSSHQVNDKYTL